MTIADFLMIIAILLAPLIAVRVSRYLDRQREEKGLRLDIFKTLMASRANPLTGEFVYALNRIDVEFYGSNNKNKAVVESLKLLVQHLGGATYSGTNGKIQESSILSWSDKTNELTLDLLQKMAEALGYEFDKSAISQTSYFPVGFENYTAQWDFIRRGACELIAGRLAVPVQIVSSGTEGNGPK